MSNEEATATGEKKETPVEEPKTKVEETPAPKVAKAPKTKVEETPAPEVTKAPETKVEETPAPEVTKAPETKVEETPAPKVAKAPKTKVKETPAPKVTKAPKTKVEETPAPKVTKAPKTKVEETPAPEVTKAPKTKVEETPAPEVAKAPKTKVEETPAPKVTKAPKTKVEETPAPEVAKAPETKVKELPSLEQLAKEETTPETKVEEKPAPEKTKAPTKASETKTEETPSLEKIAAEETLEADKFEKFRKNLVNNLFGKYDFTEVVVTDMGLARYINLDPVYIPHSGGKHAKRMFDKSKVNIIERFINKLMLSQDYTGKKHSTYKLLEGAFEKVAKRTKQNPIQILIEAIENAAPMEEATRLRFGGISVPKAVDISPSRRLDIALRNLATGAASAGKGKNKHMADCLADEIIKASKGDMTCFSLRKKEERHRYAASAR